ncbi:hypothetical protein QN277_006625 [Acacia crassicarpa]|uniref:Uncharacterized protein n=1 Tax=Acacia crassicarpa TaxID=499986 RepID=A0AAE1M803_9FABA|nr:hypothetical protein QN277_006625 [Acacia crassicarpa]
MGKPRKHSKSHTSGLVPNSRRGRTDSRLAVSKNSSTMKSLSFNTESSDNFGVQLEVFSLSKMSRVERKNLKQRLQLELEQVRKLQKKVASVNSNLPALSLSSSIISCSNGQKRFKLASQDRSVEVSATQANLSASPLSSGITSCINRRKRSKLASQDRSVEVSATQANLPASFLSSGITSCINRQKRSKLASQDRSVEVSAAQVKNRAPLGQKDPKRKRSIEPLKHSAQVTSSNAMLMKQCEDLLDCLMSHKYGYIFNEPVDIVKLNIPDYHYVIKHPMDLGTVKSRITSSQYSNPMDFAADVRLTFSNAKYYNPPGHYVHNMADTLGKCFERRWKAIKKKIPVVNIAASKSSKPTTRVETKISDQLPPLKKKRIRSNDTDVKPEPVTRIMTDDEKDKLSFDLEPLLEELPSSIRNFIEEHRDETNDDKIVFVIDALSDESLVQLRKLLDDHMLEKQKVQEKAEPCELKLPNESLQLCIDNEQVEEDVDIVGGSDVPVLSYPAVEIEKDDATANRNRRYSDGDSSSSSSSSESGSSSNDSDGSSSSGSESDADKVLEPPSNLKENLGSVLTLDPGEGNHGDSETKKDSMNMIGQIEQSPHSKAVGTEGCLEGESAFEKQVSLEKLSRADLLRSRFADTILKAREKALEKDPYKPIIEREQHERRLKKGKGRAQLQAEAKAAKEAQIKAEAEAAAEAKRKREQEREAARQALENVEKSQKTIGISDNYQLLKDLEMLGLGYYVQVGSNPLEQLGLYLKLDEFEDENEELLL